MLTVCLWGGLGNQLFQLAFLDYMSKKTGKKKYISSLKSPNTVHSNENYFETIFKNWKSLYNEQSSVVVNEIPNLDKQEWVVPKTNTMFKGYFQHYEYTDPIREEFIQKLVFNEKILEKYPDIHKKIIIHVRGGDYKNNMFHELNLTNYYKKCIEACKGESFIICTNDIPYAKELIETYEFIQENEVDTLFLMSKAKGVICANSSFSWWGAYLNPNRPIFLPSSWVNDVLFNKDGYYFHGCNIINIK
jgi:hypothetical protein